MVEHEYMACHFCKEMGICVTKPDSVKTVPVAVGICTQSVVNTPPNHVVIRGVAVKQLVVGVIKRYRSAVESDRSAAIPTLDPSICSREIVGNADNGSWVVHQLYCLRLVFTRHRG